MDWTGLRIEFPVTRQWAYFDHAAVAPITGRAQQALRAWSDDQAENGDVHERRWVRRVEEVRQLAAQLINSDAKDIAFLKNTSEGIGIVAEGFPWQPGDNIVTAAEEYPANLYPWMNLAGRGVEVRMVQTRDRRIWIDDLRQAMDAGTRIVSLSAVEYASGFRNDLETIGSLCRERGILFVVDAIQCLGVIPLDVQKTPLDFLAADGHKWMLGPEGAGIFYARREVVDKLHPVGIGWNSVVGARNFSHIDFALKPYAGRWESGSLNVAGISALGASLELLLNIGIPAIWQRVAELMDYFCARAEKLGLDIYSSRQPGDRSSIVSVCWPQGNPRRFVRRCREAGIVINQRGGRLRISPHCYNIPEELDHLAALLQSEKASVSSLV
jgi:selenocysteine lyase/cysteine desulfurase